VYFIHAEGTDLVKIGWTADIARRFDQLQTASPHPLRLLAVHAGGREIETLYHRNLQPYRQRGEWFFLTQELRRWLAIAMQSHAASKNIVWRFHYDRIKGEEDAHALEAFRCQLEWFQDLPGAVSPVWDNVIESKEAGK
jgi:hypothetical protein